jgi:hypothetical protein
MFGLMMMMMMIGLFSLEITECLSQAAHVFIFNQVVVRERIMVDDDDLDDDDDDDGHHILRETFTEVMGFGTVCMGSFQTLYQMMIVELMQLVTHSYKLHGE